MNTKDVVFTLRVFQMGALGAALLGVFLLNPYLCAKVRPLQPTQIAGGLLLVSALLVFVLATITRIAAYRRRILRRRRLARECARLDPHVEQAMAEEGMVPRRSDAPPEVE
jgi:hypothetical protein